ncbi:MAG: hypothetical protein MJK13_12050 [Pseudomonadales bacterium]|nr:hypothetical protein [Pseudomonadales bacterium]
MTINSIVETITEDTELPEPLAGLGLGVRSKVVKPLVASGGTLSQWVNMVDMKNDLQSVANQNKLEKGTLKIVRITASLCSRYIPLDVRGRTSLNCIVCPTANHDEVASKVSRVSEQLLSSIKEHINALDEVGVSTDYTKLFQKVVDRALNGPTRV